MPPASTLRPTPVTASAGAIPAFCMYRTFNAIPPTFAGVTRLTNDDARATCTVGTNGRSSRTPPIMPTPAATYVSADATSTPASHPQLADPRAAMLSSTLASCGSST